MDCELYYDTGRFEQFQAAAAALTLQRLGRELPDRPDDEVGEEYDTLASQRPFVEVRTLELGWMSAIVASCSDKGDAACVTCPLEAARQRVDELRTEAVKIRGIPEEDFARLARRMAGQALTGQLGHPHEVRAYG